MVDYAISVKDMECVDGFSEAFNKSAKAFPEHYRIVQDVETHVYIECPVMLNYLWRSGMDTTQPVEVVNRIHRTRISNEVVTGIRFEGQERTDKVYLATGAASMEAIIASSGDHDMQTILARMSAERSTETAFD